ncbi:hypothetical protein ACOME3_002782 [Neoechinorhynchus agilis]
MHTTFILLSLLSRPNNGISNNDLNDFDGTLSVAAFEKFGMNFSYAEEQTKLLLDNKTISLIDPVMCTILNRFEIVNLENNQITKLPQECIFSSASQVYLDHNNLSKIPLGMFKGNKLEFLGLMDNPINMLDLRLIDQYDHVLIAFLKDDLWSSMDRGNSLIIHLNQNVTIILKQDSKVPIQLLNRAVSGKNCGQSITDSKRNIKVMITCSYRSIARFGKL